MKEQRKAALRVAIRRVLDDELKTSARRDTDGKVTKKAPAMITKTISSVANAKGGALLIGVNDRSGAVALKPDYKTFSDRQDIDKWLN